MWHLRRPTAAHVEAYRTAQQTLPFSYPVGARVAYPLTRRIQRRFARLSRAAMLGTVRADSVRTRGRGRGR
jgi:hypothetical protein